jgi:dihydroorotate dehydrogenase electron transfer subunit
MQIHLLKIKSNTLIADKIYKLELSGNFDLQEFRPGRFLHIKCSDSLDPLLRRPMSICDLNDNGDLMTVLYRAEGRGTQLLSRKQAGETLDVLAPLGSHFELEQNKNNSKILLVGGGIGVPPLFYLGRKLKALGHEIESVLGFASAKDIFYENDFQALGKTTICTVDGTHGQKGFVTKYLSSDYDTLYACGPNPMLKALQEIIPADKRAFISVEERMGCGVGACLACVCKTQNLEKYKSGYVRVCTEGPVFAIADVIINS